MKLRALLLFTLILPAVVSAKENIKVEYINPQDTQEQSAKIAIQESQLNELITDLADQWFPFNRTLTIQYGGEQGPLYNPQSHVVHMPYHFYHEALNYFTKNEYQARFGKSPQLGAQDTILHTLLHEAAHAYIADQNIPILGKEEDAADNFAAVVMIDYIENGDDAAISAADMFAFESEDRPDYYHIGEYIDEHSFDLQRYFSTLCLVYGSDPEKHANLLNEVENDYLADRQDFCQFLYSSTSESWHHYIAKHVILSRPVT
ncbi:DUF4344 domain-containing metallopeptidase [Vibrio sonorensis]|uniref:DUF4344 domain-containing metallopeptidase n=1 Tax=Vibrio sonorensis TaxID=1004316 RepID=UPI0008D8E5EA|nr:DUF4344 domain-containing metallopeptidase [Vibrio sonorensis]